MIISKHRKVHKSLAKKIIIALNYVWHSLKKLNAYCRLRPTFPAKILNYEDYWDLRKPVEVSSRFQIIAMLVSKGSRVLDIGCGDGALLEYLERSRQVRALGVDISCRAVQMARKRGVEALIGDATSGELPDENFDHVICGEFLEHITEPEQILLAVRQMLTKSLIVSLPNVGYYQDRCRLLFGKFPIQWLHHPAEHLRFFTVDDFLDFSRDLGFRVRTVEAATGFPFLMKRWPNLFAQQVIYELEVSSD